MITPGKKLTDEILIALSETCVVFRANVGLYFTADGRPARTGLPVGFSDVFGFRKLDGKAFFLEIKAGRDRLSPAQRNFLEQMKKQGALSGVARSVDDALAIVGVRH